jgi:anti-anti-sigma factor
MTAVEPSLYTPFTISVVPDRDEVAVVAVGELDLASVDELERAVAELRLAGFASIVLDLHQVEFIDSTGLRMLITLRNEAERNGSSLSVVAPPPTTGRIFDITGTRGLFDWRDRVPSHGPTAGRRAGVIPPL